MSFLLAWLWFFLLLISLGANIVMFLMLRPPAAAEIATTVVQFIKSLRKKKPKNQEEVS